MAKKLAVLICAFVVLPWIIGGVYTSHADENEDMIRPGRMYLNGLFTMLALFEILAVPCSYLHTTLTFHDYTGNIFSFFFN